MQYKEPELPGIPPAPKTFRIELQELINKYSLENDSNTPDFVLARYLMDCLKAASRMIADREDWYGRPIRVYTEYDPAKHTTRAMVEEIPDLYAEEATRSTQASMDKLRQAIMADAEKKAKAARLTVECLSCGTKYEAGTEHKCSIEAGKNNQIG